MAEIQTGDLFRTAFLLCVGGRLVETLRDRSGHVEFVVSGADVLEADGRYRRGQAMVNPLQLKETINILRDEIFRYQREERRQDGRLDHGKAFGSGY